MDPPRVRRLQLFQISGFAAFIVKTVAVFS
jgi:hypothetical protein